MTQWKGKTEGSLLGYKIILNSIRLFGLSTAYFVLHFVTYYYFVLSKKNRTVMVDFYLKALNITRKEAVKLTRENFYVFGQTLVDRMAFLLGQQKKFTYSFLNESCLLEMEENNKGGILMSAHLGNWETAGNLLKNRVSKTINVVMIDAEVEKIKNYMDEKTGGSHFNIIAIKDDLSHVIKIKNALRANEFVAIHADRYMTGTKSIELEFMGEPVRFPYGPFLIAYKFKVPITFVYAVKETKRHYSLCATKPIEEASSPEEVAVAYVKNLEEMVKKFPEQWFNYFNYFEQ